MKTEAVSIIWIDDSNRLCIQPDTTTFERSTEVPWEFNGMMKIIIYILKQYIHGLPSTSSIRSLLL